YARSRVVVGKVIIECIGAGSRVVSPGGVVRERESAGGRVLTAGAVAFECTSTGTRVADAGGIVRERESAGGCVQNRGCVVYKRVITQESVIVGEVTALLTNRSRWRRECKARERQQCERDVSNIGCCFHVFTSIHCSSQAFVWTSFSFTVLPIIPNGLRCGLAKLKLRAHFLHGGSKRVNLPSLLRFIGLLFCNSGL